jgi:hypothetical protein
MGAVSGAEPGLMELRLGGSMATGGEILGSRVSEGWVGGRVADWIWPEALAEEDTSEAGDTDCEERADTRVAGRVNWTDTDNFPPSVSTGPPKS